MRGLGLLLAIAMVTAGCLGVEETSPDVEPASSSTNETVSETATEESPWRLEANVSLGWIAAAGTQNFAGDTTVGVRSHDQCPSASFVVPEGAGNVSISFTPSLVGPGAGAYKVEIASPDETTFIEPPIQEPSFGTDDPQRGAWRIELKPQGATVDQVWPFEIVVDGYGTPPEDLALVEDGDCLA